MTTTTKTAKAPNYTDEMVKELYEVYSANPTRETVDELAAKFGKSPKSVIAKLSSMEIYQVPERTAKDGSPIVKKEDIVKEICEALDINAESLVKANKRDLQTVAEAVRNL